MSYYVALWFSQYDPLKLRLDWNVSSVCCRLEVPIPSSPTGDLTAPLHSNMFLKLNFSFLVCQRSDNLNFCTDSQTDCMIVCVSIIYRCRDLGSYLTGHVISTNRTLLFVKWFPCFTVNFFRIWRYAPELENRVKDMVTPPTDHLLTEVPLMAPVLTDPQIVSVSWSRRVERAGTDLRLSRTWSVFFKPTKGHRFDLYMETQRRVSP